MTEESTQAAAPRQEGEPHLGVFVGAELYGLPLRRLREVARVNTLRTVPGAAAHVAGLVNLRGEIMCVLDMRVILGLSPSALTDGGLVIALRDFDFPVGLVVDAVSDIFAVDASTVDTPPADWRPERQSSVVGTADLGTGQIGLLDVDRVVNR